MNIGILGGAFNPITKAHIGTAKYVLNSKFNIHKILLLPCYKSTTNKTMQTPQHRLNMCELAINNCNDVNIQVCDFEIKHKLTGSFIQILKQFYDNVDNNNAYYFIIGLDNAININKLNDYKIIMNSIPFIIVPRIGYVDNSCDKWYSQYPHIFIENSYPIIELASSTIVRDILKSNSNQNILQYLFENVYEYILRNNLYI